MKIIGHIVNSLISNVWKTKKWVDFKELLDKLNALGEVSAVEREDKKKIYLYLNDKFISTMPIFYWEDNKKIMWNEAMETNEIKNVDERFEV